MVELSVTTEDVLICCDGKMDSTGHIPLSTFQRGFWRPGIQTPKSRLLYVSPNPSFVSWKSGVKDGEALKGRGFKPLHLEWFSFECRKTKTKVITLANHIGHRQYIEPIKTRSNYMWLTQSAGKCMRARHNWLWFYF